MILNELKKRIIDKVVNKHINFIARLNLTPNISTFISFLFALVSIYLFIKSELFYGGLALIGNYFFDFLDGQISRKLKKDSDFGFLIDKSNDLFRTFCWIAIAMSGAVSYLLASLAVFTNALGFFIGNFAEKLDIKRIKWAPCWIDWLIVLGAVTGYIIFFSKLMITLNSILIVFNILSIIILNKSQKA
jgi:phosphatidylglycerophosphate synthase